MSLLPYHKGNKTNFINLLFTLTRKSPTASGRELHDACKGPSGKEQRKGTRSVANLVNAVQDSLTCLQLAVFSQSSIYLNEITLCLSASPNSQSNS